MPYFCTPLSSLDVIETLFRYQLYAEVAHLVEHDLAKVGVAGSSPVFRSESPLALGGGFFLNPAVLLLGSSLQFTLSMAKGTLVRSLILLSLKESSYILPWWWNW